LPTKKIRSFILILFFNFVKYYLPAQNLDSLQALLKKSKEDTSKVNLLNETSRQLINNGNYSVALQMSLQAKELSRKLIFKKGEARALSYIARTCMNKGDYPEALKYNLESLTIREKLQNKKDIDNTFHDIGQVYDYQGIWEKALYYYGQCLTLRKQTDDKKGIASVYSDIGIVYDTKGDYDKALEYYTLSLKIREEIKDSVGLPDSYTNLGIVCKEQGRYDQALKYYEISLPIYQKTNYIKGVIACYNNMSDIYYLKKDFTRAQASLNKSIELAHKISSKDDIKVAYQQLTNLDSAQGDYKFAFRDYKNYILYRDSLINEESTKQTLEEQYKYDLEKKDATAKADQEKKDAVADSERRRQRLVLWLIAIVAVAASIVALIVYRSLHQNKKAKKIIETQKHEVELHQKEILDSITYAKRLQQAILPSEEEIKKYLPNSFLYYLPKDIVAGDFYWMHVSETFETTNEIYIAAADSTGHGVPGAMVSIVCSNALNRSVKEFGLINTGEILDKTRDLVLETFAKSEAEVKDGMDISLCRINLKTNSVQWSGANNPLWYIENSRTEVKEIKANKQPVGKSDNPKYFTSHSLQLQKGDQLYLMTDGYADQFGGEKGKKFKYKQLENTLLLNSNKDIHKQKNILEAIFNNWKGSLEQVDDVSIIGIKLI
jgi:tetratricopeptide (TPR) repeat protein